VVTGETLPLMGEGRVGVMLPAAPAAGR
jgi:hypothetical protein